MKTQNSKNRSLKIPLVARPGAASLRAGKNLQAFYFHEAKKESE
jgi:hypothetical protein